MDPEGMRRASRSLPVACELSAAGQRTRREELSDELFAGCEAVNELEDGYEFVFPGGDGWTAKLAHFVSQERKCCRFFGFEILFAPDLGPISLRMRGPEGTKEFLAEHLPDELSEKNARSG